MLLVSDFSNSPDTSRRHMSEGIDHLEATDVGQAQVEQDDLRVMLAGQTDAGGRVAAGNDRRLVLGDFPELDGKQFADQGVVIDAQDSGWAHAGRGLPPLCPGAGKTAVLNTA
jgi:hypothetical protein